MENYINNIVEDVKSQIKELFGCRSKLAFAMVENRVWFTRMTDSRVNPEKSMRFVCKSLKDDNLHNLAKNLDAIWYKNAVIYGDWCTLDAMLYCAVCRDKKDEILRRVKELAEEEGN